MPQLCPARIQDFAINIVRVCDINTSVVEMKIAKQSFASQRDSRTGQNGIAGTMGLPSSYKDRDPAAKAVDRSAATVA